jgi:Ca2+-binding EF-hand superfamily protein
MILDFDYLPLPIPSDPRKAKEKPAGLSAASPERAALFEKLDLDRDGKLDLKEFSAKREPQEAAAWFAARDADKDGFVSRGEFVRATVENPPKPGLRR